MSEITVTRKDIDKQQVMGSTWSKTPLQSILLSSSASHFVLTLYKRNLKWQNIYIFSDVLSKSHILKKSIKEL